MNNTPIITIAEETNTGLVLYYKYDDATFNTESENDVSFEFAIERYSDIISGAFSSQNEVFYSPEKLTECIKHFLTQKKIF